MIYLQFINRLLNCSDFAYLSSCVLPLRCNYLLISYYCHQKQFHIQMVIVIFQQEESSLASDLDTSVSIRTETDLNQSQKSDIVSPTETLKVVFNSRVSFALPVHVQLLVSFLFDSHSEMMRNTSNY